MTVVDQFSGIGWGFACRDLGIVEHGIDNEPTVAKTRERLGWDTLCADLLELEPTDWAGVEGLIASPPCQSWSRAGKGAGLDDPRGQLVWQPLVWALALRPRWVACEQVPEARGAFELIAHRLREVGYHAEVFTISAETLGVPQTRLRVFMVAHLDRPVKRPSLTHQRFRKGRPRVEPADMLGHLPWVSMAEALGALGALDTRCGWMPEFDMADRHSPTLSSVAGGKAQWVLRYRRGEGMVERYGTRPGRSLDEPCFCLTTGAATGGAKHQWHLEAGLHEHRTNRDLDQPAPTLTAHIGKDGDSWAFTRPSTTVCADPRVSPPVHHDGSQTAGAVPYIDAGSDKPIALTEAQGCTLMGFPADAQAALEGNKADRWRLIGNAVCPPVASAVLRELV